MEQVAQPGFWEALRTWLALNVGTIMTVFGLVATIASIFGGFYLSLMKPRVEAAKAAFAQEQVALEREREKRAYERERARRDEFKALHLPALQQLVDGARKVHAEYDRIPREQGDAVRFEYLAPYRGVAFVYPEVAAALHGFDSAPQYQAFFDNLAEACEQVIRKELMLDKPQEAEGKPVTSPPPEVQRSWWLWGRK